MGIRSLTWLISLSCATLFGAGPGDPRFFTQQVYPVFERANCRGCHTSEGVASATRLHFPPESAPAEELEFFGKKLIQLVDRASPESSLLLKKSTNRTSHGGGERIKPGSDDETAIITWSRHLASLRGADLERAPLTAKATVESPLLRRLTHSQYNRTVRDLLGDQTLPARQFPGEDYVDGFRNQARSQSISPLLAESYFAAAEKLARRAFRFGGPSGLVPCQPSSAVDSDCAARFVRQFGSRAFRRPLTKEEAAQFTTLLLAESKRTGQFLAGAQIVTETMLQSPNFLFRIEKGLGGGFEQYEIASRLSYALWDTAPDEDLLRSAAAGELSTPAGVEKQARRMLNDTKAREALDEFVGQWMRFDRLLTSVKDRRIYVEFVPSLAESMAEETRRLAHHLVWSDRNFMEFLSADYSFVNADLANLYQIPPPPGPFSLLKYPQVSERAGVLGHGTFLAQTGKPEETSPTERGVVHPGALSVSERAAPTARGECHAPAVSHRSKSDDKPGTHDETALFESGVRGMP